MNEEIYTNIILIVLYVSLFSSVIFIVWNQPTENKTTSTDCYDRYGSKIDGLTCQKESMGLSLPLKVIITLIIIIGWIFFTSRLQWR